MPKSLMCLVLIGFSLTACSSGGSKPSALSPSVTEQPAAPQSAQSASTTPADDGVVTTEARRELTAKELISLVCDVILIADAEVGANPVAVPELYAPEFVRQLSNRLSDAQMAKGFDEQAVKEACPKDYEAFLAKAHSTSLTGPSAP